MMNSEDYTVKLENFNGPLDLLLKLIKQNKLDICDIDIAKITGDYLNYLNDINLSHHDANRFIEIAVKLILTKSRALLPDVTIDEEDYDLEDLSEQLIVLQSYQNIAKKLDSMQNQPFFARPKINFKSKSVSYSNLNVQSIISSYQLIQYNKSSNKLGNINFIKRKMNLEKRNELINIIIDKHHLQVSKITDITKNRRDAILMFMIILEFIRSNKLRLKNSQQLEVEIVK